MSPFLTQITLNTYDGDNNTLTQTAILPSGSNSQTTAYVYGVGSTGALYSNDLLATTEYPDLTTGAASTAGANDKTYSYNFQGQQATMTDQDGDVHTYSYDVLGRETLDAITTLGTGVDGAVLALGYSFDTGGRPYQDTSYSNAAATTVVNQVQFAYDGFGQEVEDYQAVTGAVNTSTTPSTGYNYTENAGSSASITGASEASGTVTITMASAQGFLVGQSVAIAGVLVGGYNGVFIITGVTATTITYTNATTGLASSSGGTASVNPNNDRMTSMVYPNGRPEDYLYGNAEYPLSTLTHSGTTATGTMLSNVYTVGGSVTISGASDPLYDLTFKVTAVNTSTHTFSYVMSGTPAANASGADLLATTPGVTQNGSISRVSAVMDHAGTSAGVDLEEYTYMGLQTIVAINRPEADEKLTYGTVASAANVLNDGGDQYKGLDRFGRVDDQYWDSTVSSPSALDRIQYGYDRDGNVLYEKNLGPSGATAGAPSTVAGTFSQLYHANSAASGDNNTAYDPLGRLTAMRRGTLTASANNGGVLDTVTTLNTVAGVTGNQKAWSLNAVGGWNSVQTDGATAVTHTTNTQNETTAVGATALTYDNNGNLTKNSQGNTLKYDAWNRLVNTNSGTGTALEYDALGRWVLDTISTGVNDVYFDMQGHQIETLTTTVYHQYVWGFAYVNEIILRDEHTATGSNYGIAGSGLNQRLYANQDANFDTISLVVPGGTVDERFSYDAYGLPVQLTAAWANGSSLTYFFRILFQGEYQLNEANVYIMGARDFDYTIGSWDQKDPIVYGDGMNDYQGFGGDPVSRVDTSGCADTAASSNPTPEQMTQLNQMILNQPPLTAQQKANLRAGIFSMYLNDVTQAITTLKAVQAFCPAAAATQWGSKIKEVLSNSDTLIGAGLSASLLNTGRLTNFWTPTGGRIISNVGNGLTIVGMALEAPNTYNAYKTGDNGELLSSGAIQVGSGLGMVNPYFAIATAAGSLIKEGLYAWSDHNVASIQKSPCDSHCSEFENELAALMESVAWDKHELAEL